MSRSHRKLAWFIAAMGIALTAGFSIGPLIRHGVSSLTVGIVVGAFGTFCLAGIAFGLWDAQRIEVRRKAKERIWIKH